MELSNLSVATESSQENPQVSWTGRPIGPRPRRKAYILICLFAIALVSMPFYFWYDTWFGKVLPDATITEYLNAQDKPRRTQQAMVQIGERMSRGEVSARQWYPSVVALSSHPNADVRQTAAWIMGQDKHHPPFREALVRLLQDPGPLVRRTAALALAALRDAAGLEEVRGMLRPSLVMSSYAGKLTQRLKVGDFVNPGTLVARVGDEEVRAVLPGALREFAIADGGDVSKGQTIAYLSVDEAHAREALRALFLIGSASDADLVRPFLRGHDPQVIEQAAATLEKLTVPR